jgi:hypothetical protein
LVSARSETAPVELPARRRDRLIFRGRLQPARPQAQGPMSMFL